MNSLKENRETKEQWMEKITVGRTVGSTGMRLGTIGEISKAYAIIIDDEDRVSLQEVSGVSSGRWNPERSLGLVPSFTERDLGSKAFCKAHGVKYAYYAGAMAQGITSVDLVVELGKHGILSSFGAGGLSIPAIEEAIKEIRKKLPNGPYAVNLLNNPYREKDTVDLFLRYGVDTIEAAAYINITKDLVRYRVSGLSRNADGTVQGKNKIIAKVSRSEVAMEFLKPAPMKFIRELLAEEIISEEQAALSQKIAMADDITVEGDSAGHTDNKQIICSLPEIIDLRNRMESEYAFEKEVRIGAGGGISTPEAAFSVFMLGADYIVTGTVNQACLEAGTSPEIKHILSEAGAGDIMMAPSTDMFESGIRVQVLKRGTMYPMNAQKLYNTYHTYDSIESIPAEEKKKLEQRIFRKSFDEVWVETERFLSQAEPQQLELARRNPKAKMAAVFKWYLGQSVKWAKASEPERKLDYQVWCGPAIGPFNEWTKGTLLEHPENRRVANVALNIMHGAARLFRVHFLRYHGIEVYSRMKSNYVRNRLDDRQ